MKISDVKTDYMVLGILEKYEDYYDYSLTEFAIVNTTEQWRETQRQRIEALKHFEKDDSLNYIDYTDTAIGFFSFSEEHYPEIKSWIERNPMFFLDATKDEIDKLIPVPYSVDTPGIQISKNGTAIFTAYEKSFSNVLSTVRILLKEVIE